MNLDQYSYILAIAEHKSFSKAAKELFISQPYLSKIVTALEEELGIKLFNRTKSPVTLTPAGECYLEYVKDLIYAEKKMKKRMEEFTGYKRGRLTVGTLPARGSYILPYVLKKFKEKYPGIDITIEEQNALILLKHILDETLDLCCFSLLEYPAEISYVLIKTENIFMVLPPDHPLGVSCAKGNFKMPVAFPEDKMRNLSNEDFILLPKSLAMGMTARRFFEVYNIKPNIFMVTRNVETSYRLAAAGIGIAFIPEKCIRFSSFDEQPYYFTVGNPPYQLSEVVAYKKGRILSKMEQYFIDLVKEIS